MTINVQADKRSRTDSFIHVTQGLTPLNGVRDVPEMNLGVATNEY